MVRSMATASVSLKLSASGSRHPRLLSKPRNADKWPNLSPLATLVVNDKGRCHSHLLVELR